MIWKETIQIVPCNFLQTMQVCRSPLFSKVLLDPFIFETLWSIILLSLGQPFPLNVGSVDF